MNYIIDEYNILAIIPARGGSKGLQRKNILPLAGKPLIAWTIEQAKQSKYIGKVVVSTEDHEIAEISKKYGAEVPFFRPVDLATDESKTIDVIFHALDWFEKNGKMFDILILLEPTSPLRDNNDLDNAIELFIQNIKNCDSLVSVGEVHLENPYIMKVIEKDYVKPFIETENSFNQRQQLPKTYFPYGVIYLSKVGALRKHKKFYQDKTIPYFIKRWQNYEIDDLYDFICIESILKKMINEALI